VRARADASGSHNETHGPQLNKTIADGSPRWRWFDIDGLAEISAPWYGALLPFDATLRLLAGCRQIAAVLLWALTH
jgi:hypothetical protein